MIFDWTSKQRIGRTHKLIESRTLVIRLGAFEYKRTFDVGE
jgi:hypothetical protein